MWNETAAANRHSAEMKVQPTETNGSWIAENRSVYENTCYPSNCPRCKNNPNTCEIASDTRMVEKFGKRWFDDVARYTMDPSTNGVGG